MCDSIFLKLEIKQMFLLISNSTFEVQQYSLGLKALLKLELKLNDLIEIKIKFCSAAIFSGTQGNFKAGNQNERIAR